MHRRTNRVVVAALATVLLTSVLTGCLNGRVGARCRTKELGQDRNNVLVCRKGRWAKLMTKGQAARFILAQRAAATTTTAPPATTTPPPQPPPGSTGTTSLVSIGASGPINTAGGVLSGNGRSVLLLAPDGAAAGDVNGYTDLVVRDRVAGTTTLVSVGVGGAPANGASTGSAISADGRFVAFSSNATNLTATPGAQAGAVYVRDLVASTTTAASVLPDGTPVAASMPSISDDGQVVTFTSFAKGLAPGDDPDPIAAVYARNLTAGSTARVSATSAGVAADDQASMPAISANGRYVAFETTATNLVAGDGNARGDVFRHDLVTGETIVISAPYAGAPFAMPVGNDGSGIIGPGFAQPLQLSADGNQVGFQSEASDLVAGDTNGTYDAFVRDVVAGTTTRLPLSNPGIGGMSRDGRYVAFTDNPQPGLRRAQVLDRATGQATVMSITVAGQVASQDNSAGGVSDDGRSVLFTSYAPDVVPGLDGSVMPRLYVRDRTD